MSTTTARRDGAPVLQAPTGVLPLARPGGLQLSTGHAVSRGAQAALRLLGARRVVQGLGSPAHPAPGVLAAGAAVDLVPDAAGSWRRRAASRREEV